MAPDNLTLDQFRGLEYDLQLSLSRLQQELAVTTELAHLDALVGQIGAQQQELRRVEQAAMAIERAAAAALATGAVAKGPVLRGAVRSTAAASTAGATQGLSIAVNLRMAYVPTAIYHLLDQEQQPLVECQFKHGGMGVQRLLVTAVIEHYAATAVKLVRVSPGESVTVGLSPTLLPERLQAVNELTRVALTIVVENVTQAGKPLIEEHRSLTLWLLARNAAPLAVRDPSSGQWTDMSRYMGAFVTPNTPAVMRFLRSAAQHHPNKRLTGYQSDPIAPQVEAIFAALEPEGQITYVNSVIAFNPEQSARSQRVRLPRECLAEQQANCIDGTVLFASLLEAASLNPALVIVPGHALVGWQAEPTNQPQLWNYLETTMIGSHNFAEARALGERLVAGYAAQSQAAGDASLFRRWALRELRSQYNITPLE